MQTKKEPLINMFDKDKISGIYKITNKHTGMSYIGRSINLNRRKQEHIRELLKDNNSKNFQREFNKFDRNLEIYEFRVIEYVNEFFLDIAEKIFIEISDNNKLHNIRHNELGEFNFKKYSEEDIWIKEIVGYDNLLKIYVNWYENNIHKADNFKKENIFETIIDEGKSLLESDFIKENQEIKKYIFMENDYFGRIKDYISLNILYYLDKYKDSKICYYYNTSMSDLGMFKSGLIEDVCKSNLNNIRVHKIIYNASKIKSKEVKYLTEIDLFLSETFELIGFENLLEATLYYIIYLYTQKILIKHKF